MLPDLLYTALPTETTKAFLLSLVAAHHQRLLYGLNDCGCEQGEQVPLTQDTEYVRGVADWLHHIPTRAP